MIGGWWRLLFVVAAREFAALAWTPTLWGVMAIVAFLTGSVAGLAVLVPGGPAELRTVAAAAGWAMLLVAPILSLRPTIEERRTGFWEVLATSPVPASALAGGRFVGGLLGLALVAAVGLGAPFLALESLARPDLAQAICALLGVVLVGALYLSSGFLAGLVAPSAAIAYLGCLFGWVIVLVGIRSVAPQLPAAQADILFAADPVRRLETFLDARVDSFAICYFVFATIAILAACAALQAAIPRGQSSPRGGSWLRPTAMVCAWLGIASAGIALSHHDSLRVRFDATASRSWELDSSTRDLVDGLGDGWKITWVVPPVAADHGAHAQVGEVLAALDARRSANSQGLMTHRIDPLRPETGASYEKWIAELVARYRPRDEAAREAVTTAIEELEGLPSLSVDAAAALDAAALAVDARDPERQALAQGAAALRGLGAGAPVLAEQVRAALLNRSDRALSDTSDAAGVLAASHRDWSAQLATLASTLAKIEFDERSTAEVRAQAGRIRPVLLSRARRLMRVVESLEAIPPDALRDASIALAQGGAIIIESSGGIAVISDAQIGLGAPTTAGESVRVDRRFRVEQLVAGAMRSVLDAARPVAVIVHAGEASILDPTQDGQDCSGIADAMRTARIAVREWRVGREPRPIVPETAAWFIMPPRNFAIEQDASERALLGAASALIAEGRGVLLSVGPSMRPLSGREDPWATLAAGLSVRALTDTVIVDDVPVQEGKTQRRAAIEPEVVASQAILCRALAGQRVSFPVATPVEPVAHSGFTFDPLLFAEARHGRSLVRDWRRRDGGGDSSDAFATACLATAVERSLPSGGIARALVVGSPAWALSATADFTRSLGGGREALLTPGNRELAVNAALWLARLDARIGPSGSGREAPRIGAISLAERLRLTGVLAIGVPAASLAVGGAITLWRRRP